VSIRAKVTTDNLTAYY